MIESKKHDQGKLRYDLLPPELTEAVVEVLTYGANKYADNGWQNLDDFENRYYAALQRHLQAWRKGETHDEESKLPHLAHVATNSLFLLWNDQQTNK